MTDITISTKETTQSPMESDEVVEAIETVSDNEVTIAAIEANKEIEIEQIRADAHVDEAQAYAESQSNQDNELWQTLNRLASTLDQMGDRLQSLEQMQTSLASVEVAETIALEEIAEEMNDLTPQSTLAPTSETEMEVTQKSEGVEAEETLPPILEVSGKPIIRLV